MLGSDRGTHGTGGWGELLFGPGNVQIGTQNKFYEGIEMKTQFLPSCNASKQGKPCQLTKIGKQGCFLFTEIVMACRRCSGKWIRYPWHWVAFGFPYPRLLIMLVFMFYIIELGSTSEGIVVITVTPSNVFAPNAVALNTELRQGRVHRHGSAFKQINTWAQF